ncbi:MAG: CHASE2 domain-containing protein, partial [Cyanobacteriota bacterium]|nr:CHASE2 domain-containing protein [Cyanobacteriota bacterium]
MWAELKKSLWQWRGVWLAAPSVVLLVLLARFVGLLQPWEWAAYDQFMRLRPTAGKDERVVIVGINEADIQALGQAIIPDRVYAKLIEKLKTHDPRVIGLDIYRDQPVPPGHDELVKIFESTDNLIGIEKVVGDSDRERVAPPPALKNKNPPQVGANDTIVDADKIIRRALLSLPADEGEGSIPSFGMYAAAKYLESQGIAPQIAEGTDNWWQLGEAVFVPFRANDGGYVRADDGGYQILLNYRGPVRTFETVSLMDILEDRVSRDWARDRVVLIGMVGDSSNDLFFTPYSSNLIALPDPVPGVEIHANIASQILGAVLDNRPLIRSWPEPLEWLWTFGWSVIGALLAWRAMRYTGQTKALLFKAFGIIVLAAASL